MAGEARSDNFMLGTATVMMGRPEELYNLNPADHSVGLVKNFSLQNQTEKATLNQGVTNDEVFAVTVGSPVNGSFEMYEFTDQNLAYALSLDGSGISPTPGEAHETTGSVSFSGGTVTLSLVDGVGQDIQEQMYVSLRSPSTDNIIVGRVIATTGLSSGTATSATVNVTIPDAITSASIPAGTKVSVVTVLDLGSTDANEEYSMKVTGQLANGKWVTLLQPKIRVSSGLSMAFSTDNFNNMPFEFTPMKLLPNDDFYAEFKGRKGKLFLDSVKAPLV